jgi:hypothetical protein
VSERTPAPDCSPKPYSDLAASASEAAEAASLGACVASSTSIIQCSRGYLPH